ncbi:Pogo transposable element [Phytophthora cinnamomi]|uniref:Pogo transposable element n=1 Tax=Phytophthora cinnamomi TaxID=4785 RepID=UPI0035596CBF|nr:Pogo transposable element [Phytophthora cinnamomi]
MPSSRMPKSTAEKKEVVQWIEKNGGVPTPAAAYFKNECGWKVSEVQVHYWWKQRTAIKAAPALRSRLSGAGAKPLLSEIEDILFDQRLAASELGDADFVASDRWVNGFMRRYGLSLRRTTNLAVLTDDVLTDQADGKIERYGNVYVANQPKAWVDSTLLTRSLDRVFLPIFDTCSQGKGLVWDSMRAHISKMVKTRCTAKGVQMFVIPSRLTTYVQAGDIGIYKSFKDKLSPIIYSWKKSDAVLYSRGGNPMPPSVETVANWVNVAWRDVPADVVERSVAAAGFSPRFGD